MAGPGLLAPAYDYADGHRVFPAVAAPIGEHDLSVTPFAIGDWNNYLYFTFTPAHTGVVSIDLYLTTVSGSSEQAGVEAYSDTLWEDVPGWQFISEEYGGPEEDLARYIGAVTAGVPVTFDAYGYASDPATGDDVPVVDLRVRVSDVVASDAPWEEGPPLAVHFTDEDQFGVERIGVVDTTSQVYRTTTGVTGLGRSWFTGTADLSNPPGMQPDVFLAQRGLRLARRAYQVAGSNPPDPPDALRELPSTTMSIVGWNIDQTPAADGFDGAVSVRADFSALAVSPYDLAYWAGRSLAEFPPPQALDDEHVVQPGGLASGATVTRIEFAPDAFRLNVGKAPDVGPTNWLIYPARTRQEAPSRWGPSGRALDSPADLLASSAGPESLLAEPGTQAVVWTPSLASTEFTEVNPALVAGALRPEPYRQTLLIVGGAAANYTDTPPSFPFPIPDDGNQDQAHNSLDRSYTGVSMHLRVTFARVYRTVPKPTLWEDGQPPVVEVLPATRLFPRDDGRGLSAAPRVYPPPRSGRIVGGYL